MAREPTGKSQRPERLTKPELNMRQRRFVEALPTSRTLQQAALRAGYGKAMNPNHASEYASYLLQQPKIIAALEAQAEALAGVTPGQILRDLKANSDMALGREPIYDGSKTYRPEAANRSLELLGKRLRMWGKEDDEGPKREGDTYNQVVLQGFTVEQLRELLDASRAPALPASIAEAQPPLRTDSRAPAEGKRLTKSKLPAKGKRAGGVGRRAPVGGVKEGGTGAS